MDDAEWIAQIKEISDPIKMLEIIVDNQNYLGFDPYYKDLRAAMLDQAEKIILNNSFIP